MRLSTTIVSLEVPAAVSLAAVVYPICNLEPIGAENAPHPDRRSCSRANACRGDGASGRASDRGHRCLRCEKEAEDSESAEGRIPKGSARYRPERTAEIVICPWPRS